MSNIKLLDINEKGLHSSKNLEPKILDLFQNQSYKTKVLKILKKMKTENFKESLYETIIE